MKGSGTKKAKKLILPLKESSIAEIAFIFMVWTKTFRRVGYCYESRHLLTTPIMREDELFSKSAIR